MSFLAKKMHYSSVINYYQTVIFNHNIKGVVVAGWSDPILSQTIKGINKLEKEPGDVKDPLTEENLENLEDLEIMFKYVLLKNEFSFLVWIIIVFLFRTLLRVGHTVVLPHTLCERDVTFLEWRVLVNVNSSKTTKGLFSQNSYC